MTAESRGDADAGSGFAEHPLRATVLGEVHARPFQMLAPPRLVLHYAFMTDAAAATEARERLAAECRRVGVAAPPPGARHHGMPLGGGWLRWEAHAEFTTYSWDVQGPVAGIDAPLPDHPMAAGFVAPGPMLVATRLDLVTAEPELDRLLQRFDPLSLSVSAISGGRALAATDFRADESGMTRILVVDRGMTPRQAGSAVQRLIEIETYRTLALLGLPEAQKLSPEITRIEAGLAAITGRIRDSTGLEANRSLLHDLTALAGDLEAGAAASAYRFGASRAYAEIVQARLAAIAETNLEGYGGLSAFLDRRMAPAMRTCQTTWDRQIRLSERIARAADLLRTRVEIELEQQNRALLGSMNRRAHMQLRLQHTVEGLSVAAVSYYVVGLVGHVAEGAGALGIKLDPTWLTAAAVLPVVAVVWWVVRRVRRRYSERSDGSDE